MRNYFICLFFSIYFIPSLVWAQEPKMRYRAKNAVYLEAGGSAFLTANYDYLTMEVDNIKTSIRLGAGIFPEMTNSQRNMIPVVPLEFLGFIGRAAGNFEAGLGYTHRFTNSPVEPKYYITSRFGLRYQKPQGGFLFRLGYIPMLYKDLESRKGGYVLSPTFALSLGASF